MCSGFWNNPKNPPKNKPTQLLFSSNFLRILCVLDLQQIPWKNNKWSSLNNSVLKQMLPFLKSNVNHCLCDFGEMCIFFFLLKSHRTILLLCLTAGAAAKRKKSHCLCQQFSQVILAACPQKEEARWRAGQKVQHFLQHPHHHWSPSGSAV